MYTYRIIGTSETGEWIFIDCNEEDSMLEYEPFIELIKSIAMKWNNNEWQGQILPVDEMRYKVKNDPIDLTYQWDDLFGIVFERNDKTTLDDVKTFIAHHYNIS